MKSFKNTLALAATALLAGAATISCSTENGGGGGVDPLPTDMFYNFATYNGSDKESCSFTVQKNADGGQATITFGTTFKEEALKKGNRVYMAYTTQSGREFESGPGTLYALTNATGGAPVEATQSNRVSASDPIKMAEMKRTGDYLNVIFQTPVSYSLKQLTLTEKPNEKDPAYPMLGLFVKTDSEVAAYRYVQISFDVESVLEPADVKGFKVEYFGDKGLDTLTFVKANPGGIVPIE